MQEFAFPAHPRPAIGWPGLEGVQILNVVERKGSAPPPLDEIRDQVIEAFHQEERAEVIRGWIEEAKKQLAEGAKND